MISTDANQDLFSNLWKKAVSSAGWMFALRAVQLSCEILRLIVLARLLSPTDFGVFGIALLALAVLDIFSEPGFQQALIHRKGETESYLNTAWTLGLIRGVVIAALLIVFAPLVGRLFNTPSAVSIVQAIGGISILKSLTNISVVYFEKELKFSKYFQYQFLSCIAGVATAIIIALINPTVWALVYGFLATTLVRCLMSYKIDPYRPRFDFKVTKIKELWGFGRWILGSNILLFLITQGDDIVVGAVAGATSLGFYQLAYKISNIPQSEYTHLVSKIAFPLYSKLQDEKEKLRDAYFKVINLTVVICLPVSVTIFALAMDFTKIFLGEKWLPMAPALQILAVFGFFRALESTTGALFMAIGKPKYRTNLQAVQLILLALIIFPLTSNYGFVGAALAVTIYAVLINPIAIALALKSVNCPLEKALKMIALPVAGSALIVLIIEGGRYCFGSLSSLSYFLLTAALATLAYAIPMYFLILRRKDKIPQK